VGAVGGDAVVPASSCGFAVTGNRPMTLKRLTLRGRHCISRRRVETRR